MALQCWLGVITLEACCWGPWEVGNTQCWEGQYQWESCCRPAFESQGVTKEILESALAEGFFPASDQSLAARVKDEEKSERPPQNSLQETSGDKFHASGLAMVETAPPGMQHIWQCLADYDNPATRRWFLAHSGLPSHFESHGGNPAACKDGAHKFFWGLVIVKMNVAGHALQDPVLSDVAMEFGMCVPKSCDYAIVDAILMPFYIGPFLEKPWGPHPEFMHRFAHVTGPYVQPANENPILVSVSQWMSGIIASGVPFRDFLEREWPFQREFTEYQSTWWPSPRNEMVLTILLLPPLLACLCMRCGCISAVVASSHGKADDDGIASKVRSAVSLVVKGFAPQTYIEELTTSTETDIIGMHVLRIILQFIVCWQHTILFVDWLGNTGHTGIGQFLPITNSVAIALSRVNTVFACVTMHLSFESIIRLLRKADSRIDSAGNKACEANGQPFENAGASEVKTVKSNIHEAKKGAHGNGQKRQQIEGRASYEDLGRKGVSRRISIVRASCILCVWCIRRWVRQVAELGLWTFYFLEISQDIPWKPFPDFVRVWYRDRRATCSRVPNHWTLSTPLSMWILSLFFIYEPVNNLLEVHQQTTSVCHNMLVFEKLFAVSVLAAILGVVRHCCGRISSLVLASIYFLATIRWDPRWPGSPDVDMDDPTTSTLSMLPAGVVTTLLLVDVFPVEVASKITRTRVAVAIIVVGLLLDFVALGQAHTLLETIRLGPLRGVLVALVSIGASMMRWQLPMVCWFLRELIHALGVAVLLRSFRNTAAEAKSFSCVARCLSRLSLSVNLSNIFAIHYIRGRMLDHPVEFTHFTGLLYTVFAWIAAGTVSLVVYCVVSPYVTAADAVLARVNHRLVAPGLAKDSKKND